MKNLFLLPTDKPSRLFINPLWEKQLRFVKDELIEKKHKERLTQNIYITSDEEIVLNGYHFNSKYGDEPQKTNQRDIDSRKYWEEEDYYISKIILTTDDLLIKDGVQAIDDDFIEWFVKNPSCEFVKTELLNVNDTLWEEYFKKYGVYPKYPYYEKIIIPQEEQNNKLYSEQYIYEKDLYNDKVEISVLALIEIKRAFGALIKDEKSYVHKVFMDDYVHQALKELKKKYAEYFDEQIKDW